MNISGKAAAAIVIVTLLLSLAYGALLVAFITGFWEPPIDEEIIIPPDTEFSAFKVNGVREDATSTGVTGATIRAWYDANFDDIMQYSELGSFTESSGIYTTINEDYPIGADFEFWVQIYASAHFVTYAQVHMTGVRNADGTAKMAGQIALRQVDDALTWSGEANGAAFDTTDYNASVPDGGTGAGVSGTLEAEMILSAADKGLSTQVWESFDYEKAYAIDKDYPFFIKWDEITEGASDTLVVADNSIYAGTFFAAISTTQDKVDLAVDVADFDLYYSPGVNWFNIMFMNTADGQDWMYNTADASAPRPNFSFTFGDATAGGTFLATNGIGIWMDVPYNQMLGGTWDRTAAGHILGTPGDGWAWTHT